VLLLLAGCGGAPAPVVVSDDPTDVPLRAASPELIARFRLGDAAFETIYLAADGLGPDYVRSSCASCHAQAARGPGSVQKMALVAADGITPIVDPSALPWGNSVRPYVSGGATTPIAAPVTDPRLKLTLRLGPALFGRGYIEAVDDAEIERVAAEQALRSDGIAGRINRIVFTSEANPDQRYHHHTKGESGLIGRFGYKARIATLDDFTADAAQGDMSITSPMRPSELPNPDGLTDDFKPGVDIDIDAVNAIADYLRLLELPRRPPPSPRGPALFAAVLCSVCHVPSLRTRADYPIAPLAAIDAPIFSDLLLHDMGTALADGLTDGTATSQQWKTAPLIGLARAHTFLHDGRATSVAEAILLHDGDGSEARVAVAKFRALSADDQAQLIAYVSSL
jgi:CxxC motif-containing protein (DUF1111 family)